MICLLFQNWKKELVLPWQQNMNVLMVKCFSPLLGCVTPHNSVPVTTKHSGDHTKINKTDRRKKPTSLKSKDNLTFYFS